MCSNNFDFLKGKIKTEVNNLGFSHIGYCSPGEPFGFETYINWLSNGFSADMAYLSRDDAVEKRKDPRKILESVKTIIVLAIPYLPNAQKEKDISNPRIASYAIGEDYHLVIPNLLHGFMKWLKGTINISNLDYKIYTDTGPILERSYAAMSGIGWIGKNSCLIIPGKGSYFFLAEIFLNLYFTPDQSLNMDYCGNCHACIDSCPTQCIQDNRTINASNCISYLTIENKNEIPPNLREKINNWIFGCDICQQVCPWNIRFASLPNHNYFKPVAEHLTIQFDQIQTLDDESFAQIFKNSPVKRAKLKGIKRNMVTAIGNTGEIRFIPILKNMLKNESDLTIQDHIIWSIERLSK